MCGRTVTESTRRAARAARLASVVMAVVGAMGCSPETHLYIEFYADAQISSWRVGVELDGSKVLDRELPPPAAAIGLIGSLVVRLPDRPGIALVGAEATLSDGTRLSDSERIEIKPRQRNLVALQLFLHPPIDEDGGSNGDGGLDGGDGGANVTLTVLRREITGGSGIVTASVGGIDCGATCAASYPRGTAVTLTASPSLGAVVAWSGACTGRATTCVVELDGDRQVTALFGTANLVFVTAQTWDPGAFGGLAAADAACNGSAQAAGLPGSYVAWMSTSTVSARSRLGTARGWRRVDGEPFADSISSMLDPPRHVYYPIRVTETGGELGRTAGAYDYVATGTAATGAHQGPSASDWTVPGAEYLTGVAGWGADGWTAAWSPSPAPTAAHLYCFGVDLEGAVQAPGLATGRVLFLSSSSFDPSTGLAGADSVCAGNAASAGLGGTFKALIATTSAAASTRVPAGTTPWMRRDGLVIADNTNQLLVGQLEAPVDTHASGTQAEGNPFVAAGATAMVLGGSASTSCNDWAPNLTDLMQLSWAADGNPGFFGRIGGALCSTLVRVYCVAQ